MQHDAVAVVLGFAIGVLSGLFGVGGSSIATPLLRLALSTPSLIALASPLPATFPTAATGLAAYSRESLVNKRAAIWTVAGGLPAVVVGALLTRWLPGHWLMVLIALAVAGVGVEMLRPNPYSAAESARRSTQWRSAPVPGLLVVAVGVGLLSGLLANGGGFLLVPAFVLLFGASMREAAATSLVCVAFLAVPGTVTHALLGHINWWLSFYLAIGVIPGTYLGARLSIWQRQVHLRRPFGAFLLLFATYFLITQILGSV
jgi:uncharacterized membrane protein YfcA